MAGEGVLIFPASDNNSGARYEGMFENNTMNGQGTYHYNDGSRYEGLWKDGKLNGVCHYISMNQGRQELFMLEGKRLETEI